MQDFLLYVLGLARPIKKDRLASETHIDLYDYGLSGPQGAEIVLQQIRLTPNVTHINLGHNPLGDMGLSIIVDYLCLKEHELLIEELNLNNCDIGDFGLSTISRYVNHNKTLRVLYLVGNKISGLKSPIDVFVDSLNHSRVQTLVLTNNEELSDKFLVRFLGNIDAPYLRELQLSRIGLTQSSLPVLNRFLRSSACYGLRILHLNANRLSNKGLKDMIANLLAGNTTLCRMEAYANSLPGTTVDDNDNHISDEALLDTTLKALTLVLTRNSVHLRKVEHEARALLVVARVLFFTPGRREIPSADCHPIFPWRKLAPELQRYVLRFLHTTLSDAQHARVCNYASHKSTLPQFAPFAKHIKGKQECIEDYLITVGCNRFEGILI